MINFDFKSYHTRAMQASTDAEKQAINIELKAFYQSLREAEKVDFNTQLQSFLVHEYSNIQSMTAQLPEENKE